MTTLAHAITDAALSGAPETLVQALDFANGASPYTSRQNQLVFFFKPEVFTIGDAQKSADIVALALTTLATFGVEVAGSLVLSGPRLAEMQAMDRHYGFINRGSRTGSTMLDAGELDSVRTMLGVPAGTPVLGGHEFLASELGQGFTPASLDEMWAKKKSAKVKSGLYTAAYEVQGTTVVLLNGFHPQQLAHFTGDDRAIALLLLHSDLPWPVLRGNMLGATFPEKALTGSLRRTLFENAATDGLGTVGIANNCAHLSAGPFEGLFELNNFLSGAGAVDFDLSTVTVAKQMLAAGLSPADIERALTNPTATVNGHETSLFDATEEYDSLSSIAMYARFFRA